MQDVHSDTDRLGSDKNTLLKYNLSVRKKQKKNSDDQGIKSVAFTTSTNENKLLKKVAENSKAVCWINTKQISLGG